MALLAIAGIARNAGRVGPFVVAHVDHGARPASAHEGRKVADVARLFGSPFVQLRPDREAMPQSSGPEAGLRQLRYDALGRLGNALRTDVIVTAHTENDQIETILLRLLSGSSSLANAGMAQRQLIPTAAGDVLVVRPLLGIPRTALTDILAELKLDHIHDPSNDDLRYRRNRLRARVIPELRKLDAGYGPALVRSTEHARLDGEVVDRIAGEVFREIVQQSGDSTSLARSELNQLELAIATRVVRAAILELIPGDARELTYERVTAVVEAAKRGNNARIEIPYGIVAEIGPTVVRFVVRKPQWQGQ